MVQTALHTGDTDQHASNVPRQQHTQYQTKHSTQLSTSYEPCFCLRQNDTWRRATPKTEVKSKTRFSKRTVHKREPPEQRLLNSFFREPPPPSPLAKRRLRASGRAVPSVRRCSRWVRCAATLVPILSATGEESASYARRRSHPYGSGTPAAAITEVG